MDSDDNVRFLCRRMLDCMQNDDLTVIPKHSSMLQGIQNTLKAVVDISPAFVRWKNIDMNAQCAQQGFVTPGDRNPADLVSIGSCIFGQNGTPMAIAEVMINRWRIREYEFNSHPCALPFQ
jgi:hypothetical protein